VLSGRGLCDELITHPEESCPALGPSAAGEKINNVKCGEEYGKIPQSSSRNPLCRFPGVFVVLSVVHIRVLRVTFEDKILPPSMAELTFLE
jgi:hypothetical protein